VIGILRDGRTGCFAGRPSGTCRSLCPALMLILILVLPPRVRCADFGESAEDLRIEGWISIGFGLMLLAAPTFQVGRGSASAALCVALRRRRALRRNVHRWPLPRSCCTATHVHGCCLPACLLAWLIGACRTERLTLAGLLACSGLLWLSLACSGLLWLAWCRSTATGERSAPIVTVLTMTLRRRA